MAAGIFRYGGTPYSIPSSSCADVKAAMTANWAPSSYAVANSCSADPVVVGTVITFTETASGVVSTVSILELTATPNAPVGTMDSGFVVAALLVLVLYALGYQSGRALV